MFFKIIRGSKPLFQFYFNKFLYFKLKNLYVILRNLWKNIINHENKEIQYFSDPLRLKMNKYFISNVKRYRMNHHTGTISGWRLHQVVEGRTSSSTTTFVTSLTGRVVHVRLLAGRAFASRRRHIRHGCCHFTDFLQKNESPKLL